MHPRRLTVAAFTAAFLVFPATSAHADGTGDAWNNAESIGAEANSPGGTQDAVRSKPRRKSRSSDCTYHVLPPEGQENAEHMAAEGWRNHKRGEGPGRWFRKVCGADETGAGGSATVVWVPQPQPKDTETLAERALRDAALPVPGVVTSPPADEPQVVNLPMWLAVDPAMWTPVGVSATAGTVTVTTTAKPEKVVWDFGNGDQVVCDGPGNRYDRARPAAEQRPDCSYTWTRPGTYDVTATVVWRVSWAAVGFAGGGDLGTAQRSTTVPIEVAEIQAVNRLPRQGG